MIHMHSRCIRWSGATLLLAFAAITPAGAQRIATTGPISRLPAPVPLDTTGRSAADTAGEVLALVPASATSDNGPASLVSIANWDTSVSGP